MRLHATSRVVTAISVLAGVGCSDVAIASPSRADGQCTFVLKPPKVVQNMGATFVMAMLEPGPCTLDATQNISTVCLFIQGDNSAGQCGNASGHIPAVVYYTYRPGAAYVVTGQGCVDILTQPHQVCQNFGPEQVTI